MSGREVDGTAVWRGPAPQLPNGRVMARLARFVPPGRPTSCIRCAARSTPRRRPKNTWPELDIAADSFTSQGPRRRQARARSRSRRRPIGGSPSSRSSIPPGASTAAAGGASAASSRRPSSTSRSTREDAGAFLDRFGYPGRGAQRADQDRRATSCGRARPTTSTIRRSAGNFTLQHGRRPVHEDRPGHRQAAGRAVAAGAAAADHARLPRRVQRRLRVRRHQRRLQDPEGPDAHGQPEARGSGGAGRRITGDIDLAKETQQLDVRVKPALSTRFSAAAGAAVLFLANPSSAPPSARARCSRRSS